MALSVKIDGEEDSDTLEALRQQGLCPSKRTATRWAARMAQEGQHHACEMSDNAPAETLKGNAPLMLSIFRLCCPKATVAEANAFLFGATAPGLPFRFHTESQITEAENFLSLSRKRASTAAHQASLPVHLAKRHSFWNDPCSFGVNGTGMATLTDWDEAAIFTETANRGCGKVFLNRRVNEEGPCNHNEKHTITAAIQGGATGGC